MNQVEKSLPSLLKIPILVCVKTPVSDILSCIYMSAIYCTVM